MAVDMVCGMIVDEKTAAAKTTYEGDEYHFCATYCRDVFTKEPEKRLPATMNISFDFLEGESIVLNLDMKRVAVSTGSACTSGSLEPSHVLVALGLPPATAQGAIRFSLGRDNLETDVDYVLDELPPIIQRLRAMSPLYADKMKSETEH